MTITEVSNRIARLRETFKSRPHARKHIRYFDDIVNKYFDIGSINAKVANGRGSESDGSFDEKIKQLELQLHNFHGFLTMYDPYTERVINQVQSDIYLIADACMGKYGSLLQQIELRYQDSCDKVANWVIREEGSANTPLSSLIPMDVIDSRHFSFIGSVICTAIAVELYFMTHKSILDEVMSDIRRDFSKNIEITNRFIDVYSIGNALDILGSNVITTVLGYDFLDTNYWPWKDNLIETLDMLFSKINFNSITYTKMKLLNSSDYMGMNTTQAALMQLVKEVIHRELEYKQKNPKVFNKGMRTKNIIDVSMVPSVVQRQLSTKTLIRMMIGYIALDGFYTSNLFDLATSGERLSKKISECENTHNIERINNTLKRYNWILED